MHSHAAHASSTTTTTRTVRPVKANKLTYEDKLVQKYIEKYMFQDDVYEPFESTYKEYIQDERSGVKAVETLEDLCVGAGEVTSEVAKKGAKPKVIAPKVRGTRGISKEEKKKFSIWDTFVVMNGRLSDFLRKTLKLNSRTANEVSILTILFGGSAVLLCGVQYLFNQFKTLLFKREGERYGGRE